MGKEILETQQADLSMTFENFVKIYNEDMTPPPRAYLYSETIYHKHKASALFSESCQCRRSPPPDARSGKWQNALIAYRDKKDKPYSETYLRTINNQLSAIMNYAVRYYDLKKTHAAKPEHRQRSR